MICPTCSRQDLTEKDFYWDTRKTIKPTLLKKNCKKCLVDKQREKQRVKREFEKMFFV